MKKTIEYNQVKDDQTYKCAVEGGANWIFLTGKEIKREVEQGAPINTIYETW